MVWINFGLDSSGLGKGPCTNDVSTQGRRGVSQFLTIGGGGCVISILEILTGGGGGVENPEN